MGLRAGDLVNYQGRPAMVVRAYEKDVWAGCVPVVFLDREGVINVGAFINAPADSLYRMGQRVLHF